MRSTRTARRSTPRGRKRSVKKRRIFIGGNPEDLNTLNELIQAIRRYPPGDVNTEELANQIRTNETRRTTLSTINPATAETIQEAITGDIGQLREIKDRLEEEAAAKVTPGRAILNRMAASTGPTGPTGLTGSTEPPGPTGPPVDPDAAKKQAKITEIEFAVAAAKAASDATTELKNKAPPVVSEIATPAIPAYEGPAGQKSEYDSAKSKVDEIRTKANEARAAATKAKGDIDAAQTKALEIVRQSEAAKAEAKKDNKTLQEIDNQLKIAKDKDGEAKAELEKARSALETLNKQNLSYEQFKANEGTAVANVGLVDKVPIAREFKSIKARLDNYNYILDKGKKEEITGISKSIDSIMKNTDGAIINYTKTLDKYKELLKELEEKLKDSTAVKTKLESDLTDFTSKSVANLARLGEIQRNDPANPGLLLAKRIALNTLIGELEAIKQNISTAEGIIKTDEDRIGILNAEIKRLDSAPERVTPRRDQRGPRPVVVQQANQGNRGRRRRRGGVRNPQVITNQDEIIRINAELRDNKAIFAANKNRQKDKESDIAKTKSEIEKLEKEVETINKDQANGGLLPSKVAAAKTLFDTLESTITELKETPVTYLTNLIDKLTRYKTLSKGLQDLVDKIKDAKSDDNIDSSLQSSKTKAAEINTSVDELTGLLDIDRGDTAETQVGLIKPFIESTEQVVSKDIILGPQKQKLDELSKRASGNKIKAKNLLDNINVGLSAATAKSAPSNSELKTIVNEESSIRQELVSLENDANDQAKEIIEKIKSTQQETTSLIASIRTQIDKIPKLFYDSTVSSNIDEFKTIVSKVTSSVSGLPSFDVLKRLITDNSDSLKNAGIFPGKEGSSEPSDEDKEKGEEFKTALADIIENTIDKPEYKDLQKFLKKNRKSFGAGRHRTPRKRNKMRTYRKNGI